MSDLVEQMRGAVRHWWTSLVIGLLAVILGVWCFITPMSTLGALTMLFIVAFFASGIFEVVFAVANRHMHGWGWTLSGGIVDLLLGFMLAASPAPVATAVLIYFVGFWIMLRSLWAIGPDAPPVSAYPCRTSGHKKQPDGQRSRPPAEGRQPPECHTDLTGRQPHDTTSKHIPYRRPAEKKREEYPDARINR